MTQTKRRGILYGVCVVLGAGLLFAGYGITLPPDPGTQLSGARVLASLGQTDEAIAMCDQVLDQHPECVDAYVYRATFLAQSKRHAEAVEAYDDALAKTEKHDLRLDLMQDRASVLLEIGREEEFVKVRDELADRGEKWRAGLLDGLLAAHHKEWARAVKALQAAADLAPENKAIKARLWNAHMERGREALAGGAFGEAQQAFDAARELFPKAYDAHLQAAEVRLALEKPEEAVAIIRALGKQTPGIAPLIFRASVGLLKKEKVEGALDALEAAYVLDPSGTKALLEKESAWKPYRDRESVRLILERDLKKSGGSLPPSK